MVSIPGRPENTPSQPASGRQAAAWQYWLALLAATVILSLPVIAVRHPPLVDYPNHLARAYILAHYHDNVVFQQNYVVRWEPIPNLALDFIVTSLLRWFGVLAAGRIFLVFTIVLFVAGCHLLGRAVHEQTTWLSIPCAFFVYCSEFLWGFMNFVFGLALFLICLALWLRWRGTWTPLRLVLVTLLVTGVYFAHLMDYAFAGIAISVATLWYWSKKENTVGGVLLDIVPLVPAALVFLAYMGHGGSVGSIEWDTLTRKAGAAVTTVLTYRWTIDWILLAAFLAVIIATYLCSRRVRIVKPLFAVVLVFFLLYLAMPYKLFTGAGADTRFIPPALVLLVLSLKLDMSRRAARLLLLGWLAVSVIRLGVIWNTWRHLDKQVETMISSFNDFPLDSRVYPAICMDCENKPERGLHHAILYATIYRDAFVPSLLAFESQEVVHLRRAAEDPLPGTSGWINDLKSYDFAWSYVISSKAERDLQRCCTVVAQGNEFAIWQTAKNRASHPQRLDALPLHFSSLVRQDKETSMLLERPAHFVIHSARHTYGMRVVKSQKR